MSIFVYPDITPAVDPVMSYHPEATPPRSP